MLEQGIRSTGGYISTYLRSIIGTYTPTDPTSMAGADWEYIFAGIIFSLSVYCLFRIIGSLFK